MAITENGYETTPRADILAEVQKVFTDALGTDLSLEAATPQGQLISAITDMLVQIDENRQADFYSRDIYKAQGLQLDIIGRELGLPRKDSIPTQLLVNIKGAVNFTIPSGTLANIITDNTQVFEFTDDVQISSETQQTTITATDGQVYENLTVGQQLQTQEYMPQVYDIAIVSIVYGQAAESDYQYRLRLIEAQSANVSEVEHLTLALEKINNVKAAYVEPNNTLETSATGIPPHAVEIVVLGGAEQDIAETIMGYIFATPTYKDPTLGEDITATDYNGHEQIFHITRPALKDVTVVVTYKNKTGQHLGDSDITALTEKVEALINSVTMNKTLYRSDIYEILTDDYAKIYALVDVEVLIAGTNLDTSYTCGSREYLQAGSVSFVEE